MRSGRRGGGVAMLSRESFSLRAVPVVDISGTECVGLVWDSPESMAFLLVYRAPSAPADSLSQLLETVSEWSLRFPRLVVLGDFNVHADTDSCSAAAMDLVSTMETLGLLLCSTGPTHQAGHTLDLIFSAGIQVTQASILEVPWSDHCALRVRLEHAYPPGKGAEPIWARPRRLMEPSRFQNALKDLEPVSDSIDVQVDMWNIRLSNALDEIAPRRPLQPRRNRSPWFTEELRSMKREKRRLEGVWRELHDRASRSAYRAFMESYEHATIEAKRVYYASLIESASSRPAKLFKIIRSLTTVPTNPKSDDQTPSAEAFQSYFADKISLLRRDLPATTDTMRELETPWPLAGPTLDQFIPLDAEGLDRLIAAARPTTCSLDPCPSWLVKSCLEGLRDPLLKIINSSLEQGVFPEGLKEAVVSTLLKKPDLDRLVPSSYRPVSNLSFLGKVIERAVAVQLQQFLDDTAGLDPFQSGFRAGHGTETVLVSITDHLRCQLDRGGSVLLVLLDLTAAFDTVDHNLLTHCLAVAGVRGTALNWLASFLHNRGQRVERGGLVSERSPLHCGVPQGAILSPLLFNIYMQPLAQLVRDFGLECYQYADDTQLVLKMEGQPESVPDSFHQCLEAIIGWLRSSSLRVNPAKTEFLWLGRPGSGDIQLPTLDGEVLRPSSLVKSLGVLLDPSLTMQAQVSAVTKTAFFHLRQARRLAPYLSRDNLATVIQATVISRLDYCNALYIGLPVSVIRKLKLVQNAAARLLAGVPIRCHITPILRQLHWLPIEHRITFKVMVLTFKALHGPGPMYLRDRLTPYKPQRSLRSEDQDLLEVPSFKTLRLTATRRRAFSVVAPSLWNTLPPEVRALRDLLAFRRACKTHLFRQAFEFCC
uniref:Reverse transcriptase domain-containing protein n=1 Tax=Anolis carolinensis TaxID=28377 RepID=A0A803SMB9_ANOCA